MTMGTAWAWYAVPETTGRSIEEIDRLFEEGVSAREFGKAIEKEKAVAA